MAKAKKTTDTAAEPAAKKKPAARKAPARKPAAKKKAGTENTAAPMIDTGLAAQSAARMLLARSAGAAASPAAAQGASSDFQQLKDSLSRPKAALDSLLHTTAPKNTSRANVPFHQQKQVGHNQTFGADVNRTGVPRRTPG